MVEKKTDHIQKEIEISEVDALRLRKVCEKHLSRTPRSIENNRKRLSTTESGGQLSKSFGQILTR